jgi:replication factor C subunit 3/5
VNNNHLNGTSLFISSLKLCLSFDRILEARERLYELIAHCIPAEVIFKGLLDELLANCDDLLKSQITQIAAEYEHRLRQGSKEIFHLEAFIAKFMCVYKQHMQSMAAGLDECFD